MNTSAAVALVAGTCTLVLAAAASAQEATPDRWNTVASPQSRAAVVERLAVPRPGGRMADYYFSDLVPSTKTRAQVATELEQARRSGELGRIQAEAYTAPPVGDSRQVASGLSSGS